MVPQLILISLNNQGKIPNRLVVQDCFEPFTANVAQSDMLMSVPPRPQTKLGIVKMDNLQSVKSYNIIEPSQCRIHTLPSMQIHSSRIAVTGVHAYPDPLLSLHTTQNFSDIFERLS